MKNQIKFILLSVFLSLGFTTFGLAQNVYLFDAGAPDSKVAPGAILLSPDKDFTHGGNWGWHTTPSRAFDRDNLSRSRSDLTVDGVVGDRLVFAAKLKPGNWWVTFWLEAGMEDSSTVQLKLNGESRNPDWHIFAGPSEPRESLQKVFRTYHGQAEVTNDIFTIELTAGNDPIRLLGLELIHEPVFSGDAPGILAEIEAVGRYGSTVVPADLYDKLANLSEQDPADAFSALWLRRLGFLIEAERHFELRGWEWAREESGLSIFDRFRQAVMLLDGLINRGEGSKNPLYERSLGLRGRILYWLAKERGGKHNLADGLRDLGRLYKRYPDDKVLAMYAGEKIDLPDACDDLVPNASAPEWSNVQREVLCRMRQIAHWWVTEQQAENGEFGGKLGDDVELFRWWVPLTLSGDKLALNGWQKLADGVWVSPKLYEGYSKRPLDVEHAAEYISDTAPLMVLHSDATEYADRLRYSSNYFKNLWTGQTEKGNRLFKSSWFSSTEVLDTPPRNRDLDYNARAVKAVRYDAWISRDNAVIQALYEWTQTWVKIAMGTDKGKPIGIIPASVRFPDEAVNGDSQTWYASGMYWDYFEWEHNAGSMLLDQMLFTCGLTGDESLLAPLRQTLGLIARYENQENLDAAEIGSEAWTVAVLRRNKGFWSVASQWRLTQQDSTHFDPLFLRYGTQYLRFRLTGDHGHLVKGMQRTLATIRFNTPMLTTEAVHTDRVYVPNSDHLKAMLTGDGMVASRSPYYAVTWEDTDDDFTALVTDASPTKLRVDLFSHSTSAQRAVLRFWQLQPGKYEMTTSSGSDSTVRTVELKKMGQRVRIDLPAQQVFTVAFRKAK